MFFSVLNNKCNKANKKEDRENILCGKVPLKVLSYYHASGFNFVHILEFPVITFHYLHIFELFKFVHFISRQVVEKQDLCGNEWGGGRSLDTLRFVCNLKMFNKHFLYRFLFYCKIYM